ncbi:methyltransferase domain-containing protein [Streptomyces sp. NBC_01433]|uniref:class I SAM-dependent methyltransferase n=1 Tax=Streptomyces sp. NBC_01433 TaxID=2903864 RepID=UPI002254A4CF|nr:class I SAM-dependent methyltransferase [Streptomyces sp. NBC_01433]MCX4681811.1 methyltransferase domain-containing protein [Streptomyces sp. NBC_01433]
MTVDIAPTSARSVATIYNSAVAAFTIAAAWEVGALEELYRERTLDTVEFAERNSLDALSTTGLFRAMASVGLVHREGATVTPLSGFDAVYHNKSFFHWLARGSSELFQQIPRVLRNEQRTGAYYRRDPAAIAFACREIDDITYAPAYRGAIDRLDFPVTRVADLGCGSGGRLMDLLRRFPGSTGTGVDIAAPSLEVARKEAADAGLSDRAEFVQGDVLRLEPRPEFADIELVTCFMMGHDFWPRENCVATLRRLREVFPSARRLLIGDATRTALPDTELPVFTLGFELGHDLMGTFLPTVDNWESVFAEGGWELVRTNRIELTVGEVIFELA